MKSGAALAEAATGPDAIPSNDSAESAKSAGLRYVSDGARGISRRRAGKGFIYTNADGKLIHDAA
jgi:DNA topoisomerase IB